MSKDRPFIPQPIIEEEGAARFQLRDAITLRVRWHSPKQSMVEMWTDDAMLAPDVGNLYASAFRERLVKAARAHFAHKGRLEHLAADIDEVAIVLGARTADGQTLLEQLKEIAERSITERLIVYARESATLFHNAEQEAFASVRVATHLETYEVDSPTFRLWLRHEFWRRERQAQEALKLDEEGALHEGPVQVSMPPVVRDNNLQDAVRQLESLALFEGHQEEVYVRVAGWQVAGGGFGPKVYLDLADDRWRVVEIDEAGWRVVGSDDSPVRFVRPKGMTALPEPSKEGSLEPLDDIINFGNGEDGKRNKTLILAWLVQVLIPTGPYPVLVLLGPQGAAKSNAQRHLRNLADPNVAPASTRPKNEHDTHIDASANWIVAYDNLSDVRQWLSDVLCTLSTGSGFKTRTLYTNRDQEIFKGKRPVILNGIGNVVKRPDLLDRALLVNLPRITSKERKDEREIDRLAEEARPKVLGALLDAVAAGLRRRDEVALEERPRMADFAVWATACEEALGIEPGGFLSSYLDSRNEATETALSESIISEPFIEFAKLHQGEANACEGSPTDLLAQLNARVEEDLKHSKDWPQDPGAVTRELNQLVPALLEIGIHYGYGKRTKSKRVLRAYYAPESASSKR
jgi:hypothetical protein